MIHSTCFYLENFSRNIHAYISSVFGPSIESNSLPHSKWKYGNDTRTQNTNNFGFVHQFIRRYAVFEATYAKVSATWIQVYMQKDNSHGFLWLFFVRRIEILTERRHKIQLWGFWYVKLISGSTKYVVIYLRVLHDNHKKRSAWKYAHCETTNWTGA